MANWSDHPIVLLGGAFAAGLGAAVSIAVPIYTTSQQNAFQEKEQDQQKAFDEKLKEIENRYAQDKSDIQYVRQLKDENSLLKEKISNANVELWKLAEKKPFVSSSPIPVGFEAVRKGEPIGILKSLFPGATIKSEGGYIYVNLKQGFIRLLQVDVQNGKIFDIDYYVQDGPGEQEKLMAAVTAAFGPPKSRSAMRHNGITYGWTVNNHDVSVNGTQYSVQ